jgi:hypothetical protein
MGVDGLIAYLAGERELSGVAQRSLEYQIAIAIALTGNGDDTLLTDKEYEELGDYYRNLVERNSEDEKSEEQQE